MGRKFAVLFVTTALVLGACSHGGSRHFGGGSPPPGNGGGGGGGGGGGNPPPPPPPPGPTASTGTLGRTTDLTTGLTGEVLHVGGNVVLGLADNTDLPLIGGVGETLNTIGDALQDGGVGGLPILGDTLGDTIQTVDGQVLNPIAAVEVVGLPTLGSDSPQSSQLIGAGILTDTAPSGTLATVNLLPQDNSVPVTVALGDTVLIGASGAGGPVNGVTGLVAGLTGGVPGGGAGDGLGAVTGVVEGVTGPLTGGGLDLSLEGALGGVLEIAPTPGPGGLGVGGVVGGVLGGSLGGS